MPCHDGDSRDNLGEILNRLDVTTRLACEYMTRLESGEVSGGLPMYALKWWRRHQELDREVGTSNNYRHPVRMGITE